jgi:hypothetical protein
MRASDGSQQVDTPVLGEFSCDCFLDEATTISAEGVDAADERRRKVHRNSIGSWHRELSQRREL